MQSEYLLFMVETNNLAIDNDEVSLKKRGFFFPIDSLTDDPLGIDRVIRLPEKFMVRELYYYALTIFRKFFLKSLALDDKIEEILENDLTIESVEKIFSSSIVDRENHIFYIGYESKDLIDLDEELSDPIEYMKFKVFINRSQFKNRLKLKTC